MRFEEFPKKLYYKCTVFLKKTLFSQVGRTMQKTPRKLTLKTLLSKGLSTAIIVEVAVCLTGYVFFRAVNHNADFRYKLYTRNNFTRKILETYYTIGEKTSSEFNVRSFDQEMWKTLGRDL
jgi:hypothetical protein